MRPTRYPHPLQAYVDLIINNLKMDNLNKEICAAHFNLICALIKLCFTHPIPAKSWDRILTSRAIFARSNMLKKWCDCSENFEYKKLSKRIIAYNKKHFGSFWN